MTVSPDPSSLIQQTTLTELEARLGDLKATAQRTGADLSTITLPLQAQIEATAPTSGQQRRLYFR